MLEKTDMLQLMGRGRGSLLLVSASVCAWTA